MIWRLTYCNKKGVEARVDIIKGDTTSVEIVKGSSNPFTLSYKLDKNDKSGHIMTSSADIEIYETETFNIDDLKTSNETELKVEYFEDNVLTWSGFILPDFFSREIGSPNIVRMTASDRLTALKGVILSNLPAKVSLRDLIELSLVQTGLSLGLVAQIQINQGSTNILDSEILSQRLTDTRGRSISCYDILMSIMVATNSTIRQREGQWVVYNKLEHELRTPTIFFDKVERGAIRTIQPVASSVGVYQEFGGGRLHPDNYDFSQGLTGWTTVGGFIASIDNRQIDGFSTQGTGQAGYFPIYGAATENSYLVNCNQYERNVNPKYLESAEINIPYNGNGAIEVEIDVNATGPLTYPGSSFAPATLRISVVAVSGTETLTLDHSGKFIPMPSTNPPIFSKDFGKALPVNGVYKADSIGMKVKGTLEVGSLENYKLKVRIYGGTGGRTILVNMISLSMKNTQEIPKGNIYKIEQGSNFTKEHEIDTSIWGDYLIGGLNGYFYNYPIDDTSNLYLPSGELSSPTWITLFDTTERPLLHHISRQKSRLFSVAHDILRANINVESFDPLAVFQDCKGGKYVVVSARFDFLRSEVDVELEQIAYDNTILKRDFIYSYFGDGDSGIKSIGGISSGASGGTGIDPGLIGGINERIDDVNDKVNNIKVGPANLLLNTGFLGDFQSLTVDALTAVTGNTPINTNPLVHWVYSNTEVIDAPSRSGKGVKIGSIQQTVTLKQGSHVLSFWAKGNSLTVDLVESVSVSIDSEYKKYSFDITVANSGAYTFSLSGDASIYEIMLSEGNAEVSYSYSEEDDLKAIAQLQAINVITDAIKNYDTDILGGLILTSMIQLGKYKDGVMEKVNAGISGIYNNDNDPAVWAGGTMEMAIRTVQKFIENPNYQPTEEEWAEMAKIVFTHGGDGFFRGYIYALGGIFRGRVETNAEGNRIVIDPITKDIRFIDHENNEVLKLAFVSDRWAALSFTERYPNGNIKKIVTYSNNIGYEVQEYDEDGGQATPIRYGVDGAITNRKLIDMTDEAADAILVSGQWYRTGRIVKVKP